MRKTILPVLMTATISLSLLACGSNKAGELDTHQIWAKVPSQELFDMLEKELKNTKKGEQT